jgi:hypothetical protein
MMFLRAATELTPSMLMLIKLISDESNRMLLIGTKINLRRQSSG